MLRVLLLQQANIRAPNGAVLDVQNAGDWAGRTVVIARFQLPLPILQRAWPEGRRPMPAFELFKGRQEELLAAESIPIYERSERILDPHLQVGICISDQVIVKVARNSNRL